MYKGQHICRRRGELRCAGIHALVYVPVGAISVVDLCRPFARTDRLVERRIDQRTTIPVNQVAVQIIGVRLVSTAGRRHRMRPGAQVAIGAHPCFCLDIAKGIKGECIGRCSAQLHGTQTIQFPTSRWNRWLH